MTPVACQLAWFRLTFTGPPLACSALVYGTEAEGERCSRMGVGFALEGVEPSRLPDDVRACRRVTLPRSLRISSTLCTSSGGFGFLSLIYKSRCRPKEEEVNGALQNGQVLSLVAGGLAGPPESTVDPGVATRGSGIWSTILI